MTGTRIKRGGSSKLSTGQGARKPRPRISQKQKSIAASVMARIPNGEAVVQRALTWGIVLVVVVALWQAARFFGLPAMVHMEMAELASRAGYEVKKVEVHGVEKMDEMAVYSIALGQVDRSMLTVDLFKVRDDVMTLSWVKDARVSRRLPDALVVDIVEREPVAVWQYEGALSLIDETGVLIESITPDAMPELPLLVGREAHKQAERFAILMEAAPALKSKVFGATWVGNRRWDLRFDTGETLALPEGDMLAAAALVNFARLDGINRLLGRDIARFDMRDPDRLVMRMPKGQVIPRIIGNDSGVSVEPEAEGQKPTTFAPSMQKLASKGQG